MDWLGKTDVITGASSGIGRALAKVLAARGARVGVLARRSDLLQELLGEVRANGGIIDSEVADVTERSALAGAIDPSAAEARTG